MPSAIAVFVTWASTALLNTNDSAFTEYRALKICTVIIGLIEKGKQALLVDRPLSTIRHSR